jgi:uncharacterized membrane protein
MKTIDNVSISQKKGGETNMDKKKLLIAVIKTIGVFMAIAFFFFVGAWFATNFPIAGVILLCLPIFGLMFFILLEIFYGD